MTAIICNEKSMAWVITMLIRKYIFQLLFQNDISMALENKSFRIYKFSRE